MTEPNPSDTERTTVAEPVDVPIEHHEEAPKGTLLIVGLFLLMMIFMFGWAYLLLIVRG
ncbi:MAG: hypothetical protein AAGA17_03595 [Actinomycetota bacterium]